MFQEYMKKTTDTRRYLSAHHHCMGGVVGYHHKCFENTNGFPNAIFEWGVEDRILFYRTKHKGYDSKNENNLLSNNDIIKQFILKTHNRSDSRICSKWLKSYSDTQHKAFETRHQNNDCESLLQSDGLNTLPSFNIVEQYQNGNIRHVKVSI
jgi:hypothetical protein